MRKVVVFVVTLGGLSLLGCGNSAAGNALLEAAAYTAIEVAAGALQSAADDAAARDAAKQAARRDASRSAPVGNWRLLPGRAHHLTAAEA
jgi:outer membrane murein-binding lipoprotein Lpp